MSVALTRRRLLLGAGLGGAALVAGCVPSRRLADLGTRFLHSGEWLGRQAHLAVGRTALAREYRPEDISPDFRTNGATLPDSPEWAQHARTGFDGWRLRVGGLVGAPSAFSLAELKAMQTRTQITRHDCVEGWSAIAQWTGVPLAAVLDAAGGLAGEARYVVFRCADAFRGWQYYESIDLVDALHPQTILAWGMNGAPLPIGHGAPLRLRVERQLGYKQAKFVVEIAAVPTLADIGVGRGGFWEDAAGYEWYAGI